MVIPANSMLPAVLAASLGRVHAIGARLAGAAPPRPVLIGIGLAIAGSGLVTSPHPGTDATMMAGLAVAATLSSIGGFAFSVIAGALLFHLLPDHVRLVQVMLVCSIANQALMTWAVRGAINPARLSPYMIAGLLGVPLGTFMLLHADHATYVRVAGSVFAAYGGYMLLRRPVTLGVQNALLDSGFGLLGGICGGALATPGAPVAAWIATKGWTKVEQRGTVQPFILLLQLAALAAMPVLANAAHHAPPLDLRTLFFIPGTMIGTSFGMAMFRRLSDRQFGRAINLLLVVSGLGLLV